MASWWEQIISAPAAIASDISGSASALNSTASTVSAIWTGVSDYRLWRSMGWLFLGVILLIMGMLLWARSSIKQTLTGASKLAGIGKTPPVA